jgi:hypothetical protein
MKHRSYTSSSSDMTRFLVSLIQFLLFAAVTYVILLIVWGEFAPPVLKNNLAYKKGFAGHMHSRIQEVQSVKNVDILFAGPSHAYRGFDTRIFLDSGYTSFNLGSSSQSPIQTRILFKRYLDTLNPKLVVLEACPMTFTLDGVEASLDIIANDRKDWETIKLALSHNHMKVYNSLIYSCYREWLGRNANYEERITKGEDTYISGGYVEKQMEYYEGSEASSDKQRWEFDNKQIDAFADMISLLNDRNIPFILVEAPITRARYNSYENNYEFSDLMKQHGPYYNFNGMIELDDKLHFYDQDHLNQNGVRLFNAKLIEIISSKHLRPGRAAKGP